MSISKKTIQDQYYDIVNDTNIVSKTDLYGTITFANQKFLDISGYTREELIGKAHNIVRNPEVDSSVFKDLWNTIQNKKVWRGTIKNIKKDGSSYIVDAAIFPIMDEDGEIQEYIAIRHDVTELKELSAKVENLYSYMLSQEQEARIKLESGIVNDIAKDKCKIIYKPSDILSGDFYSIYKRKDGSIFIYLMDGQGHGVTPALTVFAVSSLLNSYIYKVKNLKHLIEELYPIIKKFLGDIEQLSYTMIMISSDKENIEYVSAGMYPFLIKKGSEIKKYKANNTPFMDFSEVPKITNIELSNWESLIACSDGMIEHEIEQLRPFSLEALIKQPALIEDAKDVISNHKFDDDITMLYLNNE